MIDRQEVEELLAHMQAYGSPPDSASDIIPALCRAWLAVQDAPIVLANEWIWEHVPESLEGQRVRIVRVGE